jgi:hypothetical protein
VSFDHLHVLFIVKVAARSASTFDKLKIPCSTVKIGAVDRLLFELSVERNLLKHGLSKLVKVSNHNILHKAVMVRYLSGVSMKLIDRDSPGTSRCSSFAAPCNKVESAQSTDQSQDRS